MRINNIQASILNILGHTKDGFVIMNSKNSLFKFLNLIKDVMSFQ